MQLTRLWRNHLAAGCPSELAGVEIAGTDARALDAEITQCVSAFLSNSLKVDRRIERRLEDVCSALASKDAGAQPEVAAYYQRLNELVSAVLTETKAGH